MHWLSWLSFVACVPLCPPVSPCVPLCPRYGEARLCFQAMRRADPMRMEGLCMFSATLWHLKTEVELSYVCACACACVCVCVCV